MSGRFLIMRMIACLFCGFSLCFCGPQPPDALKIGINIPLTGPGSKTGQSMERSARLWAAETNAAGGMELGGGRVPLELIITDNQSDPKSAAAVNAQLITRDQVLAVVGPADDQEALAAGEEADKQKTPLISPACKHLALTRDRSYVFRACFLDSLQGPLCANFIKTEFGFSKTAVLYDITDNNTQRIAESFREAWEKLNGPGTVVAYEHFTAQERDFSSQLIKVSNSEAQALFIPQHPAESALIVQQARRQGWQKPIIGTRYLHAADLLPACADDCRGLFFSTSFITLGAVGDAGIFIDRYKAAYGNEPDEIAALTWDSLGVLKQAVRECGRLDGDLHKIRRCLRDALAQTKDYAGVTGTLSFKGTGDPVKCAPIVKINDQGQFKFYKTICP